MHTSQLASHMAITACSFLQEHISFTVYTYLHLQSLSVHSPEIIQIEKSILLPSTDDLQKLFPGVSGGWLFETFTNTKRRWNITQPEYLFKEYFSEEHWVS